MCNKNKENRLLSAEYDQNLKSNYRPSEKDELWVSFRGQFGVNPLNSEVSKELFNNIKLLSKLQGNVL